MANVTEAAGEKGSIVIDYQYEQNTHSDSQFLKEALEAEPVHEEPVTIVTDGAYAGSQNQERAKEKNIELVTTNLTGRETEDIMGDFEPKFPRPLYLGGRGKLYVHSLKNELLPRSNLSKQFFSILKYDHF